MRGEANIKKRIRASRKWRALRVWWSRESSEVSNFGDDLGPLIIRRTTGRAVKYAPLSSCDLVGPGSVLRAVARKRSSNKPAIWGAGLIEPASNLELDDLPFLAVRGELTRNCLGLSEACVLGDTGLLVDCLLGPAPGRRGGIAFVPHYVDKQLPVVRAIAEHPHVTLVDVRADPIDVARSIQTSDLVLSSSLHGLVAAASFGIPCAWLRMSDLIIGGRWKFLDFQTAIGLTLSEVDLRNTVRYERLVERCADLATPPVDTGHIKHRLLVALRDHLAV